MWSMLSHSALMITQADGFTSLFNIHGRFMSLEISPCSMALLYSASPSFGWLNGTVWHCCHSTVHERASRSVTWFWIHVILLSNHCRFEHAILAKSGIQICWQSRGRGRAQRGPRPLAWYELWCVRFQLITRGAFRFHARPGLRVSNSIFK